MRNSSKLNKFKKVFLKSAPGEKFKKVKENKKESPLREKFKKLVFKVLKRNLTCEKFIKFPKKN